MLSGSGNTRFKLKPPVLFPELFVRLTITKGVIPLSKDLKKDAVPRDGAGQRPAAWTEKELSIVLQLYPEVRDAIHKRNPKIIKLAEQLGRMPRAVEAQLLMFRSLDRGKYSWGQMNKLCKKLWTARAGMSEQDGGAPTMGLLDDLRRLQQRAFAGEHVATRPDLGDEEWWPRGPLHAGVEALINGAIETLQGKEDGLSLFFLLGGAGNGKSFAARELLGKLGCTYGPNPDAAASRVYAMDLEESQIVVLNDATIALSSEYAGCQHVALASDLEARWEESRLKATVFFCCINRGIIIDEIRGLGRRGEKYPLGKAVLGWLDSGWTEGFKDAGFTITEPLAGRTSGDQRYRHIEACDLGSGRKIRAHALAVDVSSLIEPHWAVDRLGEMSSDEVQSPRCCSLGGDREKRLSSPAVSVARETIGKFAGQANERPLLCPIRANIEYLSRDDNLFQWANALRAAEIAGGRMLSYRDLWGLISLSILGPRVLRDQGKPTIIDVVDELLRRLDKSTDAKERATIFIALSWHRLHQAMFRSGTPMLDGGGSLYPPGFPSAAGFSLVDPALDRTSDSPSIESAMQAISMAGKPSVFLFDRRPELKGNWSKFDGELEDSLLSLIDSEGLPESKRRELISWLGGYFCRFVAMCTGKFGRDEVISDWHACSLKARGESLPAHLKKSIGGLLFPRLLNEVAGSSLFVRAFSPRSEPVSKADSNAKELLLESYDTSAIALLVGRLGDRLTLGLRFDGKVVAETALDFGLLREARLWDEAGAGGSESTRFVEPRIERTRSACLGALDMGNRGLHALISDGNAKELG